MEASCVRLNPVFRPFPMRAVIYPPSPRWAFEPQEGDPMSDHTPPVSLGAAGSALWVEIVGTYDLRTDELVALEFACSARDMESEFRKAWIDHGRPYMSKGSMGQEVEHPLIGSIARQAKACDTFLRQLKLPDDGGVEKPNQARSAANTRWAAEHGKGA